MLIPAEPRHPYQESLTGTKGSMQPRSGLRTPLRAIIKSIGVPNRPKDGLSYDNVTRSYHVQRRLHRPSSAAHLISPDKPWTDHCLSDRVPLRADETNHASQTSRLNDLSQSRNGLIGNGLGYSTSSAGGITPTKAITNEKGSSMLPAANNSTRKQKPGDRTQNESAGGQSEQVHKETCLATLAHDSIATRVLQQDGLNSFTHTPSSYPSDRVPASGHDPIQALPAVAKHQETNKVSQLQKFYAKSARGSVKHRILRQARRFLRQRIQYASRATDDWPVIMRLLEKATVQGEVNYRKRMDSLRLPKDVNVTFKGTAGNAFLEIMQRTGSHVQMMPGKINASTPGFQSLSFYGTPTQNLQALKMLPEYMQLESKSRAGAIPNIEDLVLQQTDANVQSRPAPAASKVIPLQASLPPTRNEPDDRSEELSEEDIAVLGASLRDITSAKTRSVWSEQRLPLKASGGLPKRSKEWTIARFSAYIDELTQTTPNRRPTKRTDESSNRGLDANYVVTELVALFAEPIPASFLTPGAVDKALGFLVRHNGIGHARRLFADLERKDFPLAASSFVVFLDAAARAGDTTNFQLVLRMMLRKGIRPSADVWSALHRLAFVCSPARADLVVRAMRRKGVLADSTAASEVIKTSIAFHLNAHLDKGGSMKGFFKIYDTTQAPSYGLTNVPWLSVDVLNRMLQVLLLRGRMQDADNALVEFRLRNKEARLSTATLNTFLSASLRNRDPKSAVSTLRKFTTDAVHRVVPDSITIRILFSLAWSQRCFNWLRVIWRYACTYGHADFSMQDKIFRSMLRSTRAMPLSPSAGRTTMSRNDVWTAWAGKFAVNVADGLRYAPPPDLNRQSYDISAYLNNLEHVVADEEQFTVSPSAALAREMVRLSATAGNYPAGSPELHARRKRLRALLAADIAEVTSLKPVVPFGDMVEHALQKDLAWKQRGLGLPRGLETVADQERMFEEMMRDGLRVPMRIGNAALVRRTRAMR